MKTGSHVDNCVMELIESSCKVDDYISVMSDYVDELALNNLSWTHRMVWLALKEKVDKQSNSWIGMTDCEVKARVVNNS